MLTAASTTGPRVTALFDPALNGLCSMFHQVATGPVAVAQDQLRIR